jgi:hypothetical protein
MIRIIGGVHELLEVYNEVPTLKCTMKYTEVHYSSILE